MTSQFYGDAPAATPFAEFAHYDAFAAMLLGQDTFDHLVRVVLVTLLAKPDSERPDELEFIAAMVKAAVEAEREDGMPEPFAANATGAIMHEALSLLARMPASEGRA